MSVSGQKRVLVAAGDEERELFGNLFASGQVPGWQAELAEGLDRVRFVVQLDPPDVLLLDASLCPDGNTQALGEVGVGEAVPVVFVSPADPPLILNALSHGAHQWLPRDLALKNPILLAVALHQGIRLTDLHRRAHTTAEALADCQNRVSRLVDLLWEKAGDGSGTWFSQRHMLERLDEELARVRRHGGPLTVVLGEVLPANQGIPSPEQAQELAQQAARFIGRHKRRSDVTGHYGSNGFMMVLPRVDEDEAVHCCQRLKALLAHPQQVGAIPPMHTHFGLASFSPNLSTIQGLLRRAEDALEQAKGLSDSPSGGSGQD